MTSAGSRAMVRKMFCSFVPPPSDSGQVHVNRGERGGEVQLRRSGSHLLRPRGWLEHQRELVFNQVSQS